MKPKFKAARQGSSKAPSPDPIAHYATRQKPEHASLCRTLRGEIDAVLPNAESKLWHAIPVWFIGENPVVGYKATPKHVNLLFWNGQSFDEPALKAAGKFKAAQIQFTHSSQLDLGALRRWLQKAGKDIWDYAGLFRAKRLAHKAGAVKAK